MSSPPLSDTNEEYEITKARLNPILYNSVSGMYWPNSYLYCVNRKSARLPGNKLFFSREIAAGYSSWGYISNSDQRHGQLTRYAISSTEFDSFGIDVNSITETDTYNFVDPSVNGHLMYLVPDNSGGVYFVYDEYSMPQIFAEADWRRGGVNALLKEQGISVIKVSYYADEAVDPSETYKKYIRLIYNTLEPGNVDYNGADGVITSLSTAGTVVTAYDTSTGEVDKLRQLYGTPVDAGYSYAADVYQDELSAICKEIYLTHTQKRRIFLRESQPNKLNFKDLLSNVRYREFNTALLPLITASALTTTGTFTTSGGGSYV